jgi:hypothetical protein
MKQLANVCLLVLFTAGCGLNSNESNDRANPESGSSSSSKNNSRSVESVGGKGDQLAGRALFDCQRDNYPCSIDEVTDAAWERRMEVEQQALRRLDTTGSYKLTYDWLANHEDVVKAARTDPPGLRFRVEGATPSSIFKKIGNQRRRLALQPASQTQKSSYTVTRRSASNPDDPKRVLILDPFDWDLSPAGEQIVHGDLKRAIRDGQTEIDKLVLKKNRQATPRHFANWREYKAVLLTTHGGDRFILEQTGENDYSTYTDFGINSGMLLYTIDEEVYREHSRRLKEACKTYIDNGADLLELPPKQRDAILDGTEKDSISELLEAAPKPTMGCSWTKKGDQKAMYIHLTNQFFKTIYRGKLQDKLIFLNACSSMSEEGGKHLAKGLIGETLEQAKASKSAVFGYTDTAYTNKMNEVVRILFGTLIHDGGLRTAVDEACGDSMVSVGENFAENCPPGNRASIGKLSNGARQGKYVTPGGFCRPHNCGGCNPNRWCRFCEEVDHKTQICCSPEGGEQTCVSEERTYGYMYELASWPPRSELPSFSIQ